MAKKRDVWKFNFASLESVRQAIQQTIMPKLELVRNQRTQLEEDWIRFYNMWNVEHDDSHQYHGRSKLYIPEVRKNVEAQARQLTDLAFPNDDFFACYPDSGGTNKGAELHKKIRAWQLKQSDIQTKYFLFARQQCLYGTSPVHICWDKKVEHAFKSQRDPRSGKIKAVRSLQEIYNGPDFQVRDLFKWYPLNPKKRNLDDGCIEYVVRDRHDIELLDKAGFIWNKEELLKKGGDAYNMTQLERDIERAETLGLLIEGNQGYGGTASLRPDDVNYTQTHVAGVIYARIVCPEACLDDEDPELGIPFKIEIYNDSHIGFAGRNPFFHQRPPYLVGRYIAPNADEFYGQGIPKAIQYQQYEINSKAEQAMDSVTLALNPIAFIDPAMAAQNGQFEVEPGAIWYVNPNAAKLAALPDVSQAGYAAIAQLRAQMQDFSDRSPSMPSQLSGKARTATQSSIVDTALSVDFKHFQRQNEVDVLVPMMEMWESLTDQNITDDQIIMLLGRDSGDYMRTVIQKDQLIGNYKYDWRVATDLGNKQIKARQIIDGMKVAGSLPPEAQQELNFKYSEAFRVLWKDIWQLPNADKILPDPMAIPRQDPEMVYRMIKLGLEVEVLPGDDDKAFIEMFNQKLGDEKSDSMKNELAKQILLHQAQLKKKIELVQNLMAEKQQQAAMMQQQMAQGKSGGGMSGSGNRTQLSPNDSAGDMGSGVRA